MTQTSKEWVCKDQRRRKNKLWENIVDKYKDKPILFYRYINRKIKSKQSISKLKVEAKIYEDTYTQAEIMNGSFQPAFIKESNYGRMSEKTRDVMLQDIKVEIREA